MTTTQPTAADVADVLRWIPTAPDYETWARVISAVGNTLPDTEAETVLVAWSPDQTPGETRRKLRGRMTKIGFGSLVEIARQNGFDLKAWHRERGTVRRACATFTPRPIPTPPPATRTRANPISGEALTLWNEGAAHLRRTASLCDQIDLWRGYPAGTIAELAQSGFVAAPLLRGRRAVAFAVHDHEGRQIGFHARHKPAEGERAAWSYHPPGTPALPFVLGAGFAPTARRVIVAEGQWDVIALVAALGWLAHDAAFDEHTLALGTRGTSGTKALLDEWLDATPSEAQWLLFRDADKAGHTAFVRLAADLRRNGRAVTLRHPGRGKDLNDVLRGRAVTWGEVAA